MENLCIEFSSKNGAYYSGQLLSGELKFKTDGELTLSAINIQFIGQAEVYWMEYDQVRYDNVESTRSYNADCTENYVNYAITVCGGQGPCILPCGSHKFPFQFKIPETAPSSFTGSKGNVNYQVIANIERPNVAMEYVKETLKVIAPLDLNTIPEVKNPIELEFEEVYSCFCTFNPINLNVRLPVSGYCPGQYMPIELAATNNSVIEVKEIIFQLMQRECYHNKTRGSSYEEPPQEIAIVKSGAILLKTVKVYEIKLKIPDMIAPNLSNCSIIDVGYTLNITIKMTGCMNDDQDEIEIWLGMVPLSGFQDANYVHPLQDQLPNLTSQDHVDSNITSPQNVAYVFPQPMMNDGYPTPMMNIEVPAPVPIGFNVAPPPYNPEFHEYKGSDAPSAPPPTL